MWFCKKETSVEEINQKDEYSPSRLKHDLINYNGVPMYGLVPLTILVRDLLQQNDKLQKRNEGLIDRVNCLSKTITQLVCKHPITEREFQEIARFSDIPNRYVEVCKICGEKLKCYNSEKNKLKREKEILELKIKECKK